MKTSQAGLEFIAKWEGVVLKPYKDVAGLRTIGVGHLIRNDENFPDNVEITLEKAYEILAQDVAKCEEAIKKSIKVDVNQNQFDALVSFGFNCGVGVYSTSQACINLNAGNYAGFPEALMAWSKAKVNGVLTTIPGLAARRADEGKLFSKPVFVEGFLEWNKPLLQDVQDKLQTLKLYNKRVDGFWGPSTSAAVKMFADQNNVLMPHDAVYGIPQEFLDALRSKTG